MKTENPNLTPNSSQETEPIQGAISQLIIEEEQLRKILDDVVSKKFEENIDAAVWDIIPKIFNIVVHLPDDILELNPVKVHDRLNAAFSTLGDLAHNTEGMLKAFTQPSLEAAKKALDPEAITKAWDFGSKHGSLDAIIQLADTYHLHQQSGTYTATTDDFLGLLDSCQKATDKILGWAESYTGQSFALFQGIIDNFLNEVESAMHAFDSVLIGKLIRLPFDLGPIKAEFDKIIDQFAGEETEAANFDIHAWNIAVPILIGVSDLLYRFFVNIGRSFPNTIGAGGGGGGSVGLMGFIKGSVKPVSVGNLFWALMVGGLVRFVYQALVVADRIVTRTQKAHEEEELIARIADEVALRLRQQAG